MLMMRTINIASTRLTAFMEAVNKVKDKTTVHTEAVEGEYTKEINDIEETKEQDFRRRDVIFIINQAISLLSILLKSKGRHIKSSVNIHHIH
jgi:hypothetical protein